VLGCGVLFLFSAMLSLFDLEVLCKDEGNLREFLEKYGVLRDDRSCPCGGALSDVCHTGSSAYRRCYKCRKKIYGKSSSILEGSHLTLKQWLYLAYFWAHDCAGERSVSMLGLGKATVADWSQRFRVCVMTWEATHSDCEPFGGEDIEVEADECEIGRKRKGLHGHDTDVKGDFRGLFERGTGRIFIEPYDKLKKDSDDRRFGPPTIENVRPLVDMLDPSSILYSDGARAYESLAREKGIRWSSVDHSAGEYVRRERLWGKLRVVSTQGIDGTWGRLKTFLRARGGVSQDHLESNVKEFQWRRNLLEDADPLISLLSCVRDGCLH